MINLRCKKEKTIAKLSTVTMLSLLTIGMSLSGSFVNAATETIDTNGTRIHVLTLIGSDAILLESGGHFGLIDAGEDSDYPDGQDDRYPKRDDITTAPEKACEEKVIEYLKSVGVTKDNLDFFLGTHAHSDHIGSADEVIIEFEPDRVYLTEYSDTYIDKSRWNSNLWDNQYVYDCTVSAVKAVGSELIQNINEENAHFMLGDMQLEIVNYSEDYKTTPKIDANCFSLGLKVTANGHTAFLAGDIGNLDGDEDSLANELKAVDVLKFGHHGQDTASKAYLEKLSPSIVIQTNEHHRLTDENLKNITALNARLFSTGDFKDLVKAIVVDFSNEKITTNVDGMSVYSQRNAAPVLTYYKDGVRTNHEKGFFNIEGKTYYFNGGASALSSQWLSRGGNEWSYLGSTGQIVKNTWAKDKNGWCYLDANGMWDPDVKPSVPGWIKSENDWYYLNSKGVEQKGWLQWDGHWYYLLEDGKMFTSDWKELNEKWYYFDEEGHMLTGWIKWKNDWYYLNSNGAMEIGWQYINNKWYYLKESGVMAYDWIKLEGIWYYLGGKEDGVLKTGWIEWNGNWYYSNSSGEMQTGWQYINNQWYYFKSNGQMAEGDEIPTNAPYTAYKTTTSVNYRVGPGTSYQKAGTLSKGATVQVENGYSVQANGYTWYRIKIGSNNYYVAAKYLTR